MFFSVLHRSLDALVIRSVKIAVYISGLSFPVNSTNVTTFADSEDIHFEAVKVASKALP
jgi:hypothetical protein